jgi:DNA-binding transcriptional regulator YdaS (Cro superfamily)
MKKLLLAIKIAGNQQKLAQACGVGQSTVAMWVKRGNAPVRHCADIEMVTRGIVTRQDLRPDDWQKIWPELSQAEKAQA